jgi:NDP-sugar pyrophosphorylase family protein
MKINPKVCILAAGTGSRLGSVSESLGKALLPIANSTALSFIINKFCDTY